METIDGKARDGSFTRVRRAVALLAATTLVMVGAPSQADTASSGTGHDAKALVQRARQIRGAGSLLHEVAARARKPRWLRGRLSHTYERNPVSGIRKVSTVEYVAYKGKRDRSFPRVGNVYLGQIWAGRAGDSSAGDEIVTEVKLPKRTRFAIGGNRKVRCYKGKANGTFRQLRGRKCPNRPVRGTYGWRFVPPTGSWDVPTGRWIQVIFPIRSSKRLKGALAAPPHCIVGAVKNLTGYALRNWDAPRRGEKCPNRDGHGPYQYVFVSRKRA